MSSFVLARNLLIEMFCSNTHFEVLQHVFPGFRTLSPESNLLFVGEVFEGCERPVTDHFGKRVCFGGARFATVLLLALQLAAFTFAQSLDDFWRFC